MAALCGNYCLKNGWHLGNKLIDFQACDFVPNAQIQCSQHFPLAKRAS
jgi:hypothetical protein